jgi:excisionase family DNA binding protein
VAWTGFEYRSLEFAMLEHPPVARVASVPEVAATFKVTNRTVHNWIKNGDIPSLRVGRTIRIPLDAVNALIEGAG